MARGRSRRRSKSRSKSRSRPRRRSLSRSGSGFSNFVRSMTNIFPDMPEKQLKEDSEALWKEMGSDDRRPYQRRASKSPSGKISQACGPRRGRSGKSKRRSRSRSRRRR